MRARGWVSIIVIVGLAVVLLALSLLAGNAPLLGLDLQGGVEVVLEPVDEEGEVTDEDLDVAVAIIRDRVDALGVAEPDITRQGGRVVVQIPGVDDQERALELVGQTAELRFRPVLAGPLPAEPIDLGDDTAGAEDEGTEDAEPPQASLDDLRSQDALDAIESARGPDTEDLLTMPTTPRDDDDPGENVMLEQVDDNGDVVARYYLGPTLLTGAALEGADASLQGFEWVVAPTFLGGEQGIDLFNQAASLCFSTTAQCPNQTLAIVLDGRVISAPAIQQPSFERDAIVITGNFSQGEAEDIALVLRYGALPIEFQDPAEAGFVRVVSATIGEDSLRAGLIAGLVGLILVTIYMTAYYRLLGLVAMLSLAVSATYLWVIISFFSETQGLALTLAGVTGLIVAIGVSLDSNVVYFEHVKEDVRNGRTLRSAIDRGFPVAYRTIFWANLTSLIAAAILYWLSIGSVRGFALMLGLASILDLVATYFFMRPAVHLLAQSDTIAASPGRYLGLPLPSPDDAGSPAEAEAESEEAELTPVGGGADS